MTPPRLDRAPVLPPVPAPRPDRALAMPRITPQNVDRAVTMTPMTPQAFPAPSAPQRASLPLLTLLPAHVRVVWSSLAASSAARRVPLPLFAESSA